jgi:hypothetical protein
MKKYTIGLITGALLAVSAMMFMGAKNALYNIDDVYAIVSNIESDVLFIKRQVNNIQGSVGFIETIILGGVE